MSKKVFVLMFIFLVVVTFGFYNILYNVVTVLNTLSFLRNEVKIYHYEYSRLWGELARESHILEVTNYKLLKEANLIIFNRTSNLTGSGILISCNNKTYVLSVAHLLKSDSDYVVAIDDQNKTYQLTLINRNKTADLSLFSINQYSKTPLEIALKEPRIGSRVFAISNPLSLRDIVSEGLIIRKKSKLYWITNAVHFGSSGGGVIYDLKLVGVIQGVSRESVRVSNKSPEDPLYRKVSTVYYSTIIGLQTIKNFLRDTLQQ